MRTLHAGTEPQAWHVVAAMSWRRLALVSCVKRKVPAPAPARDLYTSDLFRLMRQYAENSAERWFILSAKHGLVSPDKVIAPYEQTLNSMTASERKLWARGITEQLGAILSNQAQVLLLAGRRYREHLEPWLLARGCQVEVPLRGLPIGRQLQWLKKANEAVHRLRP